MNQTVNLARSVGRPPKQFSVEIVRELTPEDLALLKEPAGIKPLAIKKLRDSHHGLARLVAEGRSGGEISYLTGYSQSRISILKGDPAFSQLVAYYHEHLEEIQDEVAADGYAKMAAWRNDLIEEAHDRLLDTPELISYDQINDSIKISADRTGLGPSSRSTNVSFNYVEHAARRAEGRQRADRLGATNGHEVVIVDTPGQQTSPPADRDGPLEAQSRGEDGQ